MAEPIILCCGSRGWTDADTIRERLAAIMDEWPVDADEPEVIHGAAQGADTLIAEQALDLGFWVGPHPPDYKTHGKAAPHVRNDEMLARADMVLAFWNGKSRGTASVIKKARDRGIYLEVIFPAEYDAPPPPSGEER